LATDTQRRLHLVLAGLDLRKRLLSREQDECDAGAQQLEVEQAEPRMRMHDAGRSLVVGYDQQGRDVAQGGCPWPDKRRAVMSTELCG
jgi:hypothetical protein